jgi:sirohydrochlorin cobaltochelatase
MRFDPVRTCAPPRLLAVLACLLLLASTALAHGDKKQDKKGILLVAFGTSVPEARAALDNIGRKAAQAFPGMEIRWAYSSKIIRHKLAKEEGLRIDSPEQALAGMMDDGFTQVAVQSLHTIPGEEYGNLMKTTAAFTGLPKGMAKITLGAPLLNSDKDVEAAAKAIVSVVPKARKKDEAVVLMGHGTRHPGNIYYPGIQYHLWKSDPNVFVGTVEGAPSFEDVLAELKKRNIKKAYLMPLMSVAGDHARNDMAGSEADSWVSQLAKAGIAATPVLKGSGEIDAVADIWIGHLREAFARLD